jgi:predicted nucleotidyltransferase
MDEQELRDLIRKYATKVRMEQGEAVLTAVIKNVVTENPNLKTEVRTSMKIVKEEVEKANAMGDDEIESLAIEEGISLADESSEYEMLEELVVKKLTEDDILKGNLKALIIYGSYAKRLHVVGESDINFVVILTADSGEEVIQRVNEIGEELVTPEVAHIFDLMILKEEDIDQVEKFGAAWGPIHVLYAQAGEVKFGSNLFVDITISDQQIKDSAKEILRDILVQMDEIITTAKEEGLPKGELDYLIGSSVIDIVFALACHNVGAKAVELDLVKPDIHETIQEIWGDESEYTQYYPLFEQAHAFKLGIKLPDSENFVENSIKFIETSIIPLINEK